MKETITLNTHEQKRVLVLPRLLVGQLTAAEAAVLLSLSERQVRRLCAAYRKEGEARLAHGNRGRKPVQAISEEVRSQVIELATTTYAGCNYQHLRDLLAQRDGIELSRTSVRRILLAAGIGSPKKQHRRQHRRRRVRYAQEGMLVQIDGSRHAWLGDRGPWLCLIAAIDDATGTLAAAVLREEEDAAGYFLLVQQLLEQHGRPLALYHDRHSIFQQNSIATEADSREEQLAGKQDPTQFGRVLEELEITSIAARSPQAKARVQVHEHFDGHLSVHVAGRCSATTEAPLETSKMRTRSGSRGRTDVSTTSQTPSSAVVLLNQASTAELGESRACQVDHSTASGRPAATHPWRKPFVKPIRTKSLDT